ncbi:hypothetical protein B0H14DRAFT_3763256 [Mycena olivaceomarginata]|nr:hypothetical protein B0H14DRAFT_3763256 [Mycena olivaceomarginata]
MASHKTEMRITVVDNFDFDDWPALQECSILTPHSLCPRDVTVDGDELSVSHLTPNSISAKFAWDESKTPTTGNTFEAQSPFEKHKRRLRRYTAAESGLARLPAPSPLSPSQLRNNAVQYAASSVAIHIREARQSLRALRNSGRRDSTRWMAEHRLTALESLQAELVASSSAQYREDARAKREEANLVRFLGVRKGDELVPVFTRKHGLRRPPSTTTTTGPERRHITSGSPMQLQAEVMPVRHTARSEWPWETRVRSVLLNPTPATPLRIHTPTSSMALSTPTSGIFSSIGDPETPLTEVENDSEEEEEEEDEYEDYPTFRVDSARSDSPDSLEWHRPRGPRHRPPSRSSKLPLPPPAPAPQRPLPPLATNLTPDSSYAWLADPSTWASPGTSAWRGDGWEVVPVSATASAFATPTSASPTSASSYAPFARTPTSATLPATPPLPPAPAHRFWTRSGERSAHRRLPSLRPISEAARDAALYAVKPLPAPPSATSATSSTFPSTSSTSSNKSNSNPNPATPPATPQRKGRHFFAGLVRRRLPPPPAMADVVDRQMEAERERNKLRKRGSVRSLRSGTVPLSARSEQSFGVEDY